MEGAVDGEALEDGDAVRVEKFGDGNSGFERGTGIGMKDGRVGTETSIEKGDKSKRLVGMFDDKVVDTRGRGGTVDGRRAVESEGRKRKGVRVEVVVIDRCIDRCTERCEADVLATVVEGVAVDVGKDGDGGEDADKVMFKGGREELVVMVVKDHALVTMGASVVAVVSEKRVDSGVGVGGAITRRGDEKSGKSEPKVVKGVEGFRDAIGHVVAARVDPEGHVIIEVVGDVIDIYFQAGRGEVAGE